MPLRQYQQDLKNQIYAAWSAGHKNVMATLPTGGGKTKLFCDILHELGRPSCVIAHRQELVSQAALALNREEVPHGIIAPKQVVSQIVALEMETHGRSYYNRSAPIRCAGVDTLVARGGEKDKWFNWVEYAVPDEGHHVLRENKWGRALALFPEHHRGLFPTAHALRADRAGLGRSSDGLADILIVGPSYRDLIDLGYLCDFRLICPPSDVEVEEVEIGDTGDFKSNQLRAAFHKSKTIVGDVARTYMQFAEGKLGLTFAIDIEAAEEIMHAYKALGVRAAIVTGETPMRVRGQLMRQFRNRDLHQLISVDVLGEGTDVPAVEVVSLARHTASFQLYAQQVGRGSRLMIPDEIMARWESFTPDERRRNIAASDKPKFILIDHVGNWQRHLPLPDMPRAYTLEKTERPKKKKDAKTLRTCLNPICLQPFDAFLKICPWCDTAIPAPARRSSPEFVDGDLYEVDEETLAELRGQVFDLNSTPKIPNGATPEVVGACNKRHNEKVRAQDALRKTMALFGGWQKHLKRNDSEAYRYFYLHFGVDVLTAQSLNASDATELREKVQAHLDAHNVVEAI
jgi:DNA repair protein RadD